MRLVPIVAATCAVAALPSSRLSAQTVDLPVGFDHHTVREVDTALDFQLQLGGLTFAPDGAPIVYVEGAIRVLGDTEETLATFAPAVFGDFLQVDPAGEAVWFGESSLGEIYRVPLDGSGAQPVATLPSNFDLAFAPAGAPAALRGRAFVSALHEEGSSNSIFLVDPALEGGTDEVITAIPGFSGPLAFDPDGNLWYVTSTFEPLPALLRFTPEQVEAGLGAGATLAEVGEIVLVDIPGAYNLEYGHGSLWMTNLGYATGAGAIERIFIDGSDAEMSTWATFGVEGAEGLASPTHLAVHSGHDVFDPGAGAAGGRILVSVGDFSSFSHVVEITPEQWFVRGEVNGDGAVDIADAVFLLTWLFAGGEEPAVREAGDVDDDGEFALTDPVYILDYLFLGGAPIPAPFPERGPSPSA